MTTAGNAFDTTEIHELLHAGETMVFGDAWLLEHDRRPGNAGKVADLHIAMKRGVHKAMEKNLLGRLKE